MIGEIGTLLHSSLVVLKETVSSLWAPACSFSDSNALASVEKLATQL